MDVLYGLNESQKRAVTIDGDVLVVAGPGTGKTLTIVRRIGYLVGQGARPGEIAAVTFTNRAARELRERIHAFLGVQAADVFIGTFHLLGLNILRSAGYSRAICTRDEQIEILRGIGYGQAGGDPLRTAQDAAERISRSKNLLIPPDPETAGYYEAYEAGLEEKGLCDFDDLICVPLKLLSGGLAPGYEARFRHIIVDEYQDTSPAQYRLLKSLVSARCSVSAVGDSDQAIYSFRGADVRNFLDFQLDFPCAARVVLAENYRSTSAIVTAAGSLIRNNPSRIEKELKAHRGGGRVIRVVSASDDKAEAEMIVRETEARMGGTSHYRLASAKASNDFCETRYSFSDFAVLFRTNGQAKIIEEAFAAWGIPCQVAGNRHGLKRKELVDALTARTGTLTDQCDLSAVVEEVCETVDVGGNDRSLVETIAAAYRDAPVGDALLAISNELTLLTSADAFDPRSDSVALMTLHTAKGLEFKVVFIAGVEEGLVPFSRAEDAEEIEEERRLFYVGMTRARDELFLFHAASRFMYGRKLTNNPSRFVGEITAQLLLYEKTAVRRDKRNQGKQMGLFQETGKRR